MKLWAVLLGNAIIWGNAFYDSNLIVLFIGYSILSYAYTVDTQVAWGGRQNSIIGRVIIAPFWPIFVSWQAYNQACCLIGRHALRRTSEVGQRCKRKSCEYKELD